MMARWHGRASRRRLVPDRKPTGEPPPTRESGRSLGDAEQSSEGATAEGQDKQRERDRPGDPDRRRQYDTPPPGWPGGRDDDAF
jgi:hypothetical protein